MKLLNVTNVATKNPKTFQPKGKGLVAETFDWDEKEVSDEKEVTQVKVLMALADDELTVRKIHARNSEWVEITIRKHEIPHTEDKGPPDLINTEGTHEQNVQNDQMITQPTDPHITNQASTSSHPVPRDRWSRDQHIELVNMIGDSGKGMLTRSMAAKLTAASASECLFADFHSEIEPKKEDGIDYDETFAPVARMEAIRIFLAFSIYVNFNVYQMDVKSVFLSEISTKGMDDKGISICQEQYTKNLLKKYEISNSSSVKTPMVPPNNLGPDLASKPVNETSYRGIIRSLMYLTASRPDIQFSTVLCARYQSNPKESHLTTGKRILRYLKGTPTIGLYYPKCSGFDLKGYSDSDYADCNIDRKSTSGACQILGGKLVCWSAKKQQSMAMSSGEAEYVVALSDYDIYYKMVPIFCDNTSAIAISNNLVLHSRTKHIDIRYHFIRDHIHIGDIELNFIPTEYQLADIFTKPLDEPTFTRLKNAFTNCPSVVYQNFLKEFWSTAVAHDPFPSTDETEQRPLRKFLIKFSVLNGKRPLTLDFNTFCSSTGLDYNNGSRILSNSNFTKDPFKVTDIELTAYIIAVNNQKDSVSQLPLAAKPKKGKSQTVTLTLPKSQGPKVPGALSKKSKMPKSKRPPTETKRDIQLASTGFPSTLNEGTHKLKPLPKSTATHPKDSGGNKQPFDRDITSTTSDKGTTLRPEGSLGDKDSGGNIPPTNMEPVHPPVADLSGTDVRAFLLSDDESEEYILGAGEEIDEDKSQSSHAPSTEASNTDSSSDDILKKYDNTLLLTEHRLVKYLRKMSKALFTRISEDNWENHKQVAVNYADLKTSINDYYDENILIKIRLTREDENHYENANIPPPVPPTQQTPHTLSTIKLPILKKGEYDIWVMKMEYRLSYMSLLSQLKIHGAGISTEDANQKFFRSLPASWSQVSLIMRTMPGVDSLSFDDFYNNLRVFEPDIKGSTGSSSSAQNVAFVSSSTSSTNDVSTAYGVSTSSGHNSQREGSSSYTDELMYSFFANQSSGPQLDHEDLEQVDEFDLEEMDLKWQVAMISMRLKKFYKKTGRKLSKGNQESRRRDAGNTGYKAKDNGRRPGKQEEPKALVTLDGDGVDWTGHAEDEQENFALMAYSNSGSDTKVTSCSKECEESYAKLKKLYDEQREQLGDASIEIQAYTQALKKVEAQLVCHQKNQLVYEEKIRFMKIDLDDKTNVLIYHKKLLAEAVKEKEELKTKLENFQSSSKGLSKLLNSQLRAKDKSRLGYGDQIHEDVLSYENEVLESVFDSRSSDVEDSHVYDRFAKVEGMHAVPLPMTEIYMPPKSDFGIYKSKFTYGPKQSKTSESNAKTSDSTSCESSSSVETLESVPKPAVNEPKAVSKPKVWSDAPIIEEYKLDSDDEYVIKPSKEQEKHSFATVNTIKHVKTPMETVKEKNTCSPNCDFHEKRMAKQVELNKQKGKGTGQGENRPVWNNVQRLNHQNKFVPKAVLTKTGRFPVNAAR
ncbi:ribonuclease H-like domain-containing protein [Tanacetum coccineum]